MENKNYKVEIRNVVLTSNNIYVKKKKKKSWRLLDIVCKNTNT